VKSETIYRIQNCDGVGPYNSNVDGAWSILSGHRTVNGHPSPHDDIGIKRRPKDEEKCGFLSMEQLRNWFNKQELNQLKKLGFFIAEVKGRITAIGEKQILFIPDSATSN